ncbi:MAG: PLP-dependent aminotransferase family protein [Roseiflexaceae bacterium]|nr:PLP-dependent aminotransferase family protein [Roseiflexus sp.]MDW8212122.1 PLP-dependent aminotransferase family protein [Roseiflexaceae bacterium]
MLPVVQIVRRPGILDLGWGHPDPALLPVAALQRATATALERYGADALTYGAERGPGPLIEWICARLAQTDARAPDPVDVIITAGASQALDLLCTLWTTPGDTVLVESPTYHLAVRILRDHPLELAAVPSDADGVDVDALEALLARLARRGKQARMLYFVPTHHNPTGSCMSLERRRALATVAAEHGVLLVEDDVYRELSYDDPAPPSVWSIAPPGTVARIGSFSKSLAPGLRLGYVTSHASLAQRLIGSGLLDSGGGLNPFVALTVAEVCTAGDFDATVARLRAAYRERRNALAKGLHDYLPAGCRFVVPGGGFFQWVELPEGIDAGELLPRAEQSGVSYLPGSRFYLDEPRRNTLRLAFSLYSPDQLVEAAQRLGEAIGRI